MTKDFEDPDEASTRAASVESVHRVRLQGAVVEVIEGPDRGLSVPVHPGGVLVGTGLDCDLRLSDTLVSRRHLKVTPQTDGARLQDLGSRNGTYFSGVRLTEGLATQNVILGLGASTVSLRFQKEALNLSLSVRSSFGDAIARSRAMRHVFSLLEPVAAGKATVLLEGESGTGKDVLATAIHQESERREGPFIVVDCGAIPQNLIESELFGHERGAFSGAVAARPGAFEMADGGTLFLDEIGELPIDMQPKLLRVLETRTFRRVGGTKVVSVDVRVVAATNRRLREAVRRKEFREDLFYRLAIVHVAVPPLVDRPEDILPLAQLFLRKATGNETAEVPEELASLLLSHRWPGNARELRNVVERFAAFGRAESKLLFGQREGDTFSGGDDAIPLAGLDTLGYHEAKRRVVDAFHRSLFKNAIERAGGSIPRAAELLGLPKTSLYRLLQNQRSNEPEEP